MKLSTSLLSAILVGITLGSTSSCTKDKDISNPQAEKEAKKGKENKSPVPDNCPACGMG